MKKILFATALGLTAGALGYKLYKENEEEVNEFIREKLHLDDDIYEDDFELEELESLRDTINDLIDKKNEEGSKIEDDIDSFIVSMHEYEQENPKLEDSVLIEDKNQ